MLSRRKHGTRVSYAIADPSVFELCAVVCGGRQLNRYRREHRNEKSCKPIHG